MEHHDVTDPRPAMRAALDLAAEVVAAVRPDQLRAPTPCDEMDVRRLLRHLVMVARRVACAGRGIPPMQWPGEPTDLADDAVLDAFRAGAADALAAWTDAALLERPTAVPWGTFPGALTLATYVNEVTVHTWDLATATGQHPSFDDGVLALSFDAIRTQLPDDERGAMWAAAQAALPAGVPWTDPFRDAVALPEDAPLLDRLVAWNGRRP